jgi:hypothetical protein
LCIGDFHGKPFFLPYFTTNRNKNQPESV